MHRLYAAYLIRRARVENRRIIREARRGLFDVLTFGRPDNTAP